MDDEKPFYRDQSRPGVESPVSSSVSEEYEGLMTGLQLDRPSVGTRFKRLIRLAPLLLLLSITLNGFQLAYTVFRPLKCLSLYAKLPENEIVIPYRYSTDYGTDNPDEETRNDLWNAIDVSEGFVALTHEESDRLSLPRSEVFPWDSSKGMYVIHGFHALHCLTLVYTYTYDSNLGKQPLVTYHHVLHCLDLLRQDIMCHADDFLDFTAGAGDEFLQGDHQPRMCRNWNTLREWALERSACYKSVNITRAGEDHGVEHQLDRYIYCPKGSPYLPLIEEWRYLNRPNPGNLDNQGLESLTEAELKANEDAVAEHNAAVVGVNGA